MAPLGSSPGRRFSCAMQRIIVDGYNLMHARPDLRPRGAGGLEAARRHLVERLRAYVVRRAVRVTVVFDGAGHLADTERTVPGKLQVVYSAAGQSADDVIVEALRMSSNPREYIVVTSDMADIGRAAREMGARVVPSREFLERLERPAPPGPSEGKTSGGEDADVDYWLERFRGREDTPEGGDEE